MNMGPPNERGRSLHVFGYKAHLTAARVALVMLLGGAVGMLAKLEHPAIGVLFLVLLLVFAAALLIAGTISFWPPRDKNLVFLGLLLWGFVLTVVAAARIKYKWVELVPGPILLAHMLFAFRFRPRAAHGSGPSASGSGRAAVGSGHYVRGVILLVAASACFVVARVAANADNGPLLVLGLFGFFFFLVRGTRTFNSGRRLKAVAAERSPALGQRQPILYLRSFAADEETSKAPGANPRLGLYHMFAGPLSVLGFRTEEEETVSALRAWGPVVALGGPSEPLPALGAVRLPADEWSWRQTVQGLMRGSQLVVIRVGLSKSLLWEVKEAVSCVSPKRLLMLVPRPSRAYDEFREAAGVYLPRGLPPYPEGLIGPMHSSLRGIVHFDADWTPQFTPLAAPFLRGLILALRLPMRPLAVALRDTLPRVIPHEAVVE